MEKTIYKKDSRGKIRYLTFKTDEANLIQISGIYAGGKAVTNTTECKGKNIGKSNETTPAQQAEKEAFSKIKNKLDAGYFNTVAEAQNTKVLLPMLAKDYKKESHKIKWKNGVYLQAKLDGMRCIAIVKKDGSVTLMSRKGQKIQNMQHIEKALSTLREDIILDGELYVHGENFQTNMKYIKKYREGLSEKIKFCVYDVMTEDMPFSLRTRLVNEIYQSLGNEYLKEDKSFPIMSLATNLIFTEEQLKRHHNIYLKEGFEGTMVRLPESTYKINGRSSDLLKYKDFKDIACKIISIGPADRRPKWGRPVVEWNGKTFACGTKMTHEQREELLTNKDQYIGKTAEIRYFEESESGIPRFPVMVGVRLDK